MVVRTITKSNCRPLKDNTVAISVVLSSTGLKVARDKLKVVVAKDAPTLKCPAHEEPLIINTAFSVFLPHLPALHDERPER